MAEIQKDTIKRMNRNLESHAPAKKRKVQELSSSSEEGSEDADAELQTLFSEDNPSKKEGGASNAEDDWLERMDVEDVQRGPDVNPKIAEMANKRFRAGASVDKIKALQDQYMLPANCTEIQVPRVNPEVWSKLRLPANKSMKNRDLRYMNTQRAITGAGAVLLGIMDDLSKASKVGSPAPDVKGLFQRALDGVTLLGHANYDLSMRRREGLQPVLKTDYASLCYNRDLPVTSLLFGDNFTQAVKDAKHVASMGRDMSRYQQPKNWQARGGHHFRQRGRKGWRDNHKAPHKKEH